MVYDDRKSTNYGYYYMTSAAHLVLVTPDSDFQMHHEWLSNKNGGMDRVHEISGQDELMRCRLGQDGSSKRCYALVNERGGLLSVIYTYWATVPVEDETWKMLPKRVDTILQEPSVTLSTAPNVAGFYSISSFVDRTGRPLISAIYDEFIRASGTPILTTISPLRTFRAWLDQEGKKLEGTEDAKCHLVAEYLKTGANLVQRFHLGNGAQVGAIQFNANAEGSKDAVDGAGVMINYRYPRNRHRIEENLRILKSGRIPVSYHLRGFFAD